MPVRRLWTLDARMQSERKRLLREARKEAKAIARKGRSRGQEEEGEGSETDD